MAEDVHVMTVRVYYEDTDAGGIVYHGNYLRFFERARTEWMRERGFAHGQLADTHGLAFAVRRCVLEWRAPARLDDLLTITSRMASASGARLEFVQSAGRDGREIALARVELALVNRDLRPVRIPADLRAALPRASAQAREASRGAPAMPWTDAGRSTED